VKKVLLADGLIQLGQQFSSNKDANQFY